MLKLQIDPLIANDLKEIQEYFSEDNEEEYATKIIRKIYNKFENN